MRARSLLLSVLVLIAAVGVAPAADRLGRLDDGLLDPEWLGVAGTAEWRHSAGIDYLWVKPGFSLAGRTIVLEEWAAPTFLNGERDREDSRVAINLSDSMPGRLESALSAAGIGNISRTAGGGQNDVRITGRIVDCNAGSRALRLMSGSGLVVGNATWDIKIVDAATGETLAAVHHRGVSGADSRNLGEKLNLWLTRVFAPALHDGFDVYGKAPRARQ
ncbi:MAG TPA: DUF4410 domain-containing protein [Thermoanaerobaculia bacterium]|jgi:hypothetical protein|nr:DUF4410 domain-containing protein [Thermoanaerobaculia bacterium]